MREQRRGGAAERRRRPLIGALAAFVAVAAFGLTGCAPQSPDQSSWTDQAHKALEDTASEVATVELLLRLEGEGKVPGKYQQVVAQDSEEAVGAISARFGGEQPPPQDDKTYRKVTSLISDASDLLAQVRIAIVRRDTRRYPSLLHQLQSVHRDLTDGADALRTDPGDSA